MSDHPFLILLKRWSFLHWISFALLLKTDLIKNIVVVKVSSGFLLLWALCISFHHHIPVYPSCVAILEMGGLILSTLFLFQTYFTYAELFISLTDLNKIFLVCERKPLGWTSCHLGESPHHYHSCLWIRRPGVLLCSVSSPLSFDCFHTLRSPAVMVASTRS